MQSESNFWSQKRELGLTLKKVTFPKLPKTLKRQKFAYSSPKASEIRSLYVLQPRMTLVSGVPGVV